MTAEFFAKTVGLLALIGVVLTIIKIEHRKRQRLKVMFELINAYQRPVFQDVVTSRLTRQAFNIRYVAETLYKLRTGGLEALRNPENQLWIRDNDFTETEADLEQAFMTRDGQLLKLYDILASHQKNLHFTLIDRNWRAYSGDPEEPRVA